MFTCSVWSLVRQVIVKTNLLLIALQYGQEAGAFYTQGTYGWMIFVVFRLLLQNFFYQGLLNLHAILSKARCGGACVCA
jgi:hypothetical protein